MTSTAPQKLQPVVEDETAESETPEGWAIGRLPDIADIIMGQSPPGSTYNDQRSGLPFFQGKADFGERFPTARVWCSAPNKIAHPGDILISVRAPVGPTNVAKEVCAIGRGLAAITPLGGIPTDYILFALRLQEPVLALSGTGSTFTAISRKDLDEITINVAPRAEQKRIVAKIEELLAQVNAARARLVKITRILKRFRQAVLAAACSGRLTEDWRASMVKRANIVRAGGRRQENELEEELPSGWRMVSVSDIADVLGGKRTPKGTKYSDSVTAHPYIRVVDFDDMTIASGALKYISDKTYESIRKYTISANDVYISIAGSIGKVGLVPQHLDGASLTENAAKLTNLQGIAKEFLAYALNARSAQEQIEEFVTSSGQPKLALFRIEKITLLLPSAEEQQEIVRRVEALFKLADTIEKRVEAATKRTEKLTQAILAKAFRGELVPTEAELARREGRDYEPASVLLAHIKAERATKEAQTRTPRTRHNARQDRAAKRRIHY